MNTIIRRRVFSSVVHHQQHLTSRATIHTSSRLLKSTSSDAQNANKKTKPTLSSNPSSVQTEPQESWLTRQVRASPTALKLFLAVAKALGYGSPKQLAGRRAFGLYEEVCTVKADEDERFWREVCHLPPTFQSWFTITNLHIWLLTVRLRALPEPHGKVYVQALVDHFFLDVEDRIRDVLQPKHVPSKPYTKPSSFYINPNAPPPLPEGEDKAKGKGGLLARAPDRLVTRQMKIFKEQWGGMGLSMDLSLVQSDMEMAAAIWRNLLGGRGAHGIIYAASALGKSTFRRSVNLVGGEVVDVSKIDVAVEEATDDGSGVHDFPPEEADKYVEYPETMANLVAYVRRELNRLAEISDEEIINGEGITPKLKFGKVKK